MDYKARPRAAARVAIRVKHFRALMNNQGQERRSFGLMRRRRFTTRAARNRRGPGSPTVGGRGRRLTLTPTTRQSAPRLPDPNMRSLDSPNCSQIGNALRAKRATNQPWSSNPPPRLARLLDFTPQGNDGGFKCDPRSTRRKARPAPVLRDGEAQVECIFRPLISAKSPNLPVKADLLVSQLDLT
jgi:hypothetical protein